MKPQGKYVLASIISGAILGGAEYLLSKSVSHAYIIGAATAITSFIGMNWRRL